MAHFELGFSGRTSQITWHPRILVVVDKLIKYGHFIPLKHSYTTQRVAKLFFAQVYKLHGMPTRMGGAGPQAA